MVLCGRRHCLVASTLLAVRCCRGYISPCMLSTAARRTTTTSAVVSWHPLRRLLLSTAQRSSTSISGVREPMAGPAPPPMAPLIDTDGKELSKPTKRKVAIVVGYVGTAFHGWQQSTDSEVRTVEGALETALWKAGAIADSNYGDLNKIGWGRTSRTDKGVHASKTVAAAKLLLPQETFTAAGMSQYGKDKLNEHLPEDIRCFSVSKVPKSFRGRDECTLREYTYYLPKELIPNDEAMQKFRDLLGLFVGTHSFHNYASTKGRQLKEVRKRVQASIDLKMAGGGVPKAGGAVESSANAGESKGRSREGGREEGASQRQQEGSSESGGTKRWRSKEEWRTYRHKKKSTGDQKVEDDWYGKTKRETENDASGSEVTPQPPQEEPTVGASASCDDADERLGLAAPAQMGDAPGDDVKAAKQSGADVGAAAVLPEATGSKEDGDGAPERVLMLRELRTNIYRCEALEEIVSHTREGKEEPDEFVRIDISGKAFVYNQIRLMIGGALGEARGDLMPGFVEAALKTPYKIRVPLAPAEGLVLESQAFTRHTNALVLDPRDLNSLGGTLAVWGDSKEGNAMQTTGRLQTLLTLEQLEEADRWRDDHILPAVADAWEARGTASLFLEAIAKFFVGQQQEENLLGAIKEHLSELNENERKSEEKHIRFRIEAREKGSSKYKDLLPKNVATQIVCRFRLLPGNKVAAIQRGVVKRMENGELPALADRAAVLDFIEKIGVDDMALDGGFVAPDVDSVPLGSTADSAVAAAVPM